MALMPLSDLFNGALGRDSPNVECYTGDEGYGTSGIFYCETTRPVLAGEEVWFLLLNLKTAPLHKTNSFPVCEYLLIKRLSSQFFPYIECFHVCTLCLL